MQSRDTVFAGAGVAARTAREQDGSEGQGAARDGLESSRTGAGWQREPQTSRKSVHTTDVSITSARRAPSVDQVPVTPVDNRDAITTGDLRDPSKRAKGKRGERSSRRHACRCASPWLQPCKRMTLPIRIWGTMGAQRAVPQRSSGCVDRCGNAHIERVALACRDNWTAVTRLAGAWHDTIAAKGFVAR